MSEQIREQVSAFLDGELPGSETELLLKRLTRDAELRESFGRYALIGEAMRGPGGVRLSQGFADRVNAAIDGDKVPLVAARHAPQPRWWKPLAGAAVVAGVAAVAVVALQQRTIAPGSATVVANRQVPSAVAPAATPATNLIQVAANQATPASNEPVSYVTPPPSRLTNYVFAHSKYSTGLGRRGVLTDLLIEDDEVPVASHAVPPVPARAP